jgi:hypothetical protein
LCSRSHSNYWACHSTDACDLQNGPRHEKLLLWNTCNLLSVSWLTNIMRSLLDSSCSIDTLWNTAGEICEHCTYLHHTARITGLMLLCSYLSCLFYFLIIASRPCSSSIIAFAPRISSSVIFVSGISKSGKPKSNS